MPDERNFLLSQSGLLLVQLQVSLMALVKEGTHISVMVCLPLSRCVTITKSSAITS